MGGCHASNKDLEWLSAGPCLPSRTSRLAATLSTRNDPMQTAILSEAHTRFVLLQKSFPAERICFDTHPRLHRFRVNIRTRRHVSEHFRPETVRIFGSVRAKLQSPVNLS